MARFDPNPFFYVKPDDLSLSSLDVVGRNVQGLYDVIMAAIPDSAERTLAIRKLQEVRMWANCAIVMDQARTRS